MLSGAFWSQWNHVLSVCQTRRWWSTPHKVSEMMVMVMVIEMNKVSEMMVMEMVKNPRLPHFPLHILLSEGLEFQTHSNPVLTMQSDNAIMYIM